MNKELISVIIPAYNSEKYIERCVDSVKNQTYKKLEIIIINDGSTDNTGNLISDIAKSDSRIKIINQDNHGVSYTRNKGIDIAKGKYITFIDSDDYYEMDAIEHLYYIIISKNYDAVRGNYRLKKDSKVIETGVVEKQEVKDYLKLYNNIFDNSLPSYTVLLLIKREFLTNNNIYFDEKISMMEDTIFYTNLFSKHPNAFLDDKITYNYEYNQDSASKSSKYYERNLYNTIQVNKKIKSILKKNKYNENKLNSNSYNIISNYLFSLYFILNNNDWDRLYKDIISNNDFLEIESNFIYMKQLHFYISEFLLKNRKLLLLKFFYNFRKIISKIKGE